jgi:hypothetical protein
VAWPLRSDNQNGQCRGVGAMHAGAEGHFQGFQVPVGLLSPGLERYLEKRLDFTRDFLMNRGSSFFLLRTAHLVGLDGPQSADLVVERGQSGRQRLDAMELVQFPGGLGKGGPGWETTRKRSCFSPCAADETEDEPFRRAGRNGSSVAAAARRSGKRAGSEIAEPKRLLQQAASSRLDIRKGLGQEAPIQSYPAKPSISMSGTLSSPWRKSNSCKSHIVSH